MIFSGVDSSLDSPCFAIAKTLIFLNLEENMKEKTERYEE